MLPLHRGLLATVLCASVLASASTTVAQSATESAQANQSITASQSESELPDSPGTVLAKSQEPAPAAAPRQSTTPQADSQKSNKPEERLQRPVGTAAAEAPKVSGITAAQPAGAAIAPAKQRRIRTIVLKVGAIVGAGAAIGAVVALSAATPSKPPGAR